MRKILFLVVAGFLLAGNSLLGQGQSVLGQSGSGGVSGPDNLADTTGAGGQGISIHGDLYTRAIYPGNHILFNSTSFRLYYAGGGRMNYYHNGIAGSAYGESLYGSTGNWTLFTGSVGTGKFIWQRLRTDGVAFVSKGSSTPKDSTWNVLDGGQYVETWLAAGGAINGTMEADSGSSGFTINFQNQWEHLNLSFTLTATAKNVIVQGDTMYFKAIGPIKYRAFVSLDGAISTVDWEFAVNFNGTRLRTVKRTTTNATSFGYFAVSGEFEVTAIDQWAILQLVNTTNAQNVGTVHGAALDVEKMIN